MSVETFIPGTEPSGTDVPALSVTDAAQEHFRKQLAEKPDAAIRLSVKESGCTGYKYVIDIVEQKTADDIAIVLDNGVNLYVAPDAMAMIRGTTIDYTREGLNRTLKFINPNVSDECGCGESFSVN